MQSYINEVSGAVAAYEIAAEQTGLAHKTAIGQTATPPETPEPLIFQKRIDSTVYRVTAHYSQTSKETIEDKLLRLMESEVRESA